MQDENAMSSSDNVADCREPLTNMCLIAGGCRQHQAFWKMQFERSGGRSLQHKHDPALQSKNATSGDVYTLCLEDFQQNKLNISAEHLRIVWSPEDDVPEPIKNALREAMRALQTNGNGACSIHAVFGRPSVQRELFASNARQLAASLMSRLPALASEVPRAAFFLESIHVSLWGEHVRPHLLGTATAESKALMDAMESTQTGRVLITEATQCVRTSRTRTDVLSEQFASTIRSFFNVSNERALFRPIAIHVGYLPPNVDIGVLRGSRVEVHHITQAQAREYEGFEAVTDVHGYVRGASVATRRSVNHNIPSCRYSALFDPRPAFDGLRRSCMIFSDPVSNPNTFLQQLNVYDCPQRFADVRNLIEAWNGQQASEPENFVERPWSA